MLIKILTILSIIGIVMSIITIFIMAITFMTATIIQAIIDKDVNTRVTYTIPVTILLISTTILACSIII